MDESGQNIQKPKKKRKIIGAFALPHLQFATQGLDARGFPSPPVIIAALSLHLALILALASIPPIDFKRDEILPVKIVQEEIPPPPPIIEKKEVPKPIEKIIPKPKEVVKPIEKEQTIPEQKQEETEPAPVKMPEIKKLEVDIKKLKLQPNQNIENQIKLKNIDVKAPPIPQEVENIAPPLPALHKVQINRPNLENKNINTNQIEISKPINNDVKLKKIDPNIKIDAPIMPNNDLKKLQEEALKKQQELEALAKQSEAAKKPSANAPPAANGELAKPSGVTAVGGPPPNGVSQPAGGGQPPSSNSNFGDGTLPKRPPTYGSKGRNIFEEGASNGSLIGRVGASFDCAKLGVKERQEKCPNWSPLESRHKNIDPMIPQGVKKYNGPQNPLPPCPPGSPTSNLGLSCLPSKTPLNRNQ